MLNLRYLFLLLIIGAFTACGGSGGTDDLPDADIGEDAHVPPKEEEPPPPPPPCEPLTCEDLVKDGRVPCGVSAASDGCGGTLACRHPDAGEGETCPDGMYCQGEEDGVSRCRVREAGDCTEIGEEVACAAVDCGSVPTGCFGETYNCGGCDEGFFCQANACLPNTCTTRLDCSNAGPGGTAVSCGQWGDGCGGIINCDDVVGGCAAGEVCQPATGQCIEEAPPACLKTPEDACADTCGIVSDGCDGTYNCDDHGRACTVEGEFCGAANPGDIPTCGNWDACVPDTAALQAACAGKCGYISDGCAGVFDCSAPGNGGVTCTAPDTCGGGGEHNVCGVPDTGCEPGTKATVCDAFGYDCGPRADGCGGFVECGTCGAGEQCGLGGTSKCGPTTCVPTPPETACAGKCGRVSDGCDGSYDCSSVDGGITCPSGQTCGYGGVPNVCGGEDCEPETCEDRGATCGTIITCGQPVNCWPNPSNPECPNPATEACKELTPGVPVCTDQGGSGGCEGPLCGDLPPPCPGGQQTVLRGRVTTPNGTLNVPNAIVYIPSDPSATLPAITTGPTCDRCDEEDLGPVLAGAVTNHLGEFTLTANIPVGAAFNIVVKSGKWRGVRSIPAGVTTACATTNIGDTYTRLPAHKNDGLAGTQLPRIAIATGDYDAMECVFHKMGIVDDEFTTRHGDGSVHLYRANGAMVRGEPVLVPGRCSGGDIFGECSSSSCQASQSVCGGCRHGLIRRGGCTWTPPYMNPNVDGSVSASELTTRFNEYDLVVWDCEGRARDRTANHEALRDYVDGGGRFFTSDFGVDWIRNNGDMDNSANWRNRVQVNADSVYLSFARPQANNTRLRTFARWLDNEGAASIQYSAGEPHFGRMYNVAEPRDYVTSARTGAEEWLFRTTNDTEYTSPPQNWPSSVAAQTFSFNTPFGATGDNICGRVTYSGFHVAGAGRTGSVYFPDHCSGGLTSQEKVLAYMLFDLAACVSEGEPPKPPECEPDTVADCGANECGPRSDGCGGFIDCGGCPGNGYCSPVSGLCETACTPRTCTEAGYECGTHSDGCSGTIDCGSCEAGELCGYEGVGQCGSCVPLSCESAGVECGLIADGCGGYTDCGSDCPGGQVCGGGGTPNECGSGACDPLECQEWHCGIIPDGCGGMVNCSTCPEGQGCGLIEANICSPLCEPMTEAEACAGLECGWVGDGCGGAYDCGDCTNGGDCGGAGPNMCGEPCAPTSCAAEGANCGFIPDGCGELLDCGTCSAGQVCGATSPNQCGTGVCDPITECSVAGAECGTISDGCDGQLECGSCPTGYYCTNQNVCEEGEGECEPASCADLGATCGGPPDGCGGRLDCGECEPNEVCGLFVQYSCGSTG